MYVIDIINETEKRFVQYKAIKKSVSEALAGEGISEAVINIILMDNADIAAINKQYLDHDYPTDVVSFGLEETPLEGEIYIGLEIAEEQSKEYGVSLTNELQRLAVHGTLHCIGYDDSTAELRAKMTELENKYINSRT